MHVESIRGANFGTHAKLSLDLRRQGLVYVAGENLDTGGGSNGAGKTSALPDPLTWCLYGESTKGQKGDDVIRREWSHEVSDAVRVPEGCWVEVRFRTSTGRSVTVTRGRKHRELKNRLCLSVDGDDISSTTTQGTQAQIEVLIGATRATWMYTTVLGQGLSFRFSQLRDAERAHLLEDILGLQVFDDARSTARTFVTKGVGEVDREVGRLQGLRSRYADEQDRLSEAESALKAAQEEAVKRLSRLNQEHDHAENAVQKAKSRRTRLTAALDAVRVREEAARVELEEQRTNVSHARGLVEESRAAWKRARTQAKAVMVDCPACKRPLENVDVASVKASLEEAAAAAEKAGKERAASLAALEAPLEVLQDAHAKIRAEALEAAERVQKARAAFSAAKSMVAEKMRQLKEEKKQGADHLRGVVERLRKALRASMETLDAAEKALLESREGVRYASWWVDGFQRLRADRLAMAAKFVNARIARYCISLFGEGRATAFLHVEEKAAGGGLGTRIDLEVTTPGGSYQSASGGERDRVDLAVAFALHDLARAVSGFSPSLLVADEVGTFIDPEGIACLSRLLEQKAETVESIFVMSQNPVWRSHISNVWTVRREGGVSTVVTK